MRYNFLFDRRSLTFFSVSFLLLGGLLFFGGMLLGVNLALGQGTSRAARGGGDLNRLASAAAPAARVATPTPIGASVRAPSTPRGTQTLATRVVTADSAPVREPDPPAESGATQAPVAEESSAGGASSGLYTVQVGAFNRDDNLQSRMEALRSAGYQPFVETVVLDGGMRLETVRVGRYLTRAEATAAAVELTRDTGLQTVVRRLGSA